MIVTTLQGGMGNQMFQYAAGRALSLESGRPLWLETSSFRTEVRTDTVRTYALAPFSTNARLLDGSGSRWLASASVSRWPGPKLLAALRFRKWFRYVYDAEQGFQASLLAGRGSLVLRGWWQSEKYFRSHAGQVRRDFAFRAPPPPESQHWLEQIERVAAVAVHVRRGDYVTNPHTASVHGACGPDYYQAAADSLLKRVAEPRFFVFSDDPDWAEANLHLPAPTSIVRGNQAIADHEDLRLMAACRHFIIANSSFSWWGAWLGAAEDKFVVAPRRWFRNYHANTKDLLPDCWTQL